MIRKFCIGVIVLAVSLAIPRESSAADEKEILTQLSKFVSANTSEKLQNLDQVACDLNGDQRVDVRDVDAVVNLCGTKNLDSMTHIKEQLQKLIKMRNTGNDTVSSIDKVYHVLDLNHDTFLNEKDSSLVQSLCSSKS